MSDEWNDDLDDTESPEPPAASAPKPMFGNVDEFVADYLIHVYRRRIDAKNRIWAADWWRYAEAIARLEALWYAWEHLRLDGALGTSVWWRDHADHHMPLLMDPQGPFAGATDTSRHGEPLPYTPPPADMFPHNDELSTFTDTAAS